MLALLANRYGDRSQDLCALPACVRVADKESGGGRKSGGGGVLVTPMKKRAPDTASIRGSSDGLFNAEGPSAWVDGWVNNDRFAWVGIRVPIVSDTQAEGAWGGGGEAEDAPEVCVVK